MSDPGHHPRSDTQPGTPRFGAHRFVVSPEEAGKRADTFLASTINGLTRSQIKHIFDTDRISINGMPAKAGHRLRAGEILVVAGDLVPPQPATVTPEAMSLDIAYEDKHVIVVNKPQGLVVHPAAGHWEHTLVHGLVHHTTPAGGTPDRPGIVHRLDKDTSGLLVVAKTVQAHAHLARQFSERTIGRIYTAIVKGRPAPNGQVSGLIGRHPTDRKRFSGRTGRGKPSVTTFRTIDAFGDLAALLELKLGTGRTHQIRVHMSEAGHPVLGDPVYGGRKVPAPLKPIVALLPGQALHAACLEFTHPETGKRLLFRAPPPKPFIEALEMLHSLAGDSS